MKTALISQTRKMLQTQLTWPFAHSLNLLSKRQKDTNEEYITRCPRKPYSSTDTSTEKKTKFEIGIGLEQGVLTFTLGSH